jgi:protein O-mannosyl-transferase
MIQHLKNHKQSKNKVEKNINSVKNNKPILNIGVNNNTYVSYIYLFVIILITFVCYNTNLNSEFLIHWDDGEQVVFNKDIQILSISGLFKIFSSFNVGMYQPLTSLTYAFDYAIFGLSATGFHISNLIYHFIAIILLYFLLSNFFQNKKLLFFLVLLFAVHPGSVESVSWISARSNILFSVFYFSGLLVYLSYIKNHKRKYFVLTYVFFMLSCLSKSAAVTFPLILLLLNYFFDKIDRKKLIEKIPFLLISIFFIILTFKARISADHIADISDSYNYFESFILILYSLFFYFKLFFVPINNAAFYTYPEKVANILPTEVFIVLIISVVCFIVLLKVLWKQKKEAVFGLLFFIISLSAMLKFVPTGLQLTADRYIYLPMTGLLISIGYLTEALFRKYVFGTISLCIIIVLVFSIRTFTYNKFWCNEESLFKQTILMQPNAVPCKNFLGIIYRKNGNYNKALELFNEIVLKYPNYKSVYNNRGNLYKDLKNFDKALEDYNMALTLNNHNIKGEAEILTNIGIVYAMKNDFGNALDYFNKAISENENFHLAYYNRAKVYLIIGDKNNAEKDMNKVKSLKPDFKLNQ